MTKKDLYRNLPKVNEILLSKPIIELKKNIPNIIINDAITKVLDDYRTNIKNLDNEKLSDLIINLDSIVEEVKVTCEKMYADNLKPVVNASGVVIHTNLGRSVLSRNIAKKAIETACRYNNLEFNVVDGKRGKRDKHLEELICRLTGAQAAHVVNNNAAAVILVLSELAKDKNVVVSRGELVEIGGSFRIPEIMKLAGCQLKEIGCTNKTHIDDYKNAIDENTAMILNVHRSNYKIIGFTESPGIKELAILSKENKIPFYCDIGSGSLCDISGFKSFDTYTYEPTVQEIIKQGADIVSFSGDKLLGSVQAGIIAGKKEYIDRMKKNQLTRALRVDKIIISALEQSFKAYLDSETSIKNIPTLRMLSMTRAESELRAKDLLAILNKFNANFEFKLVDDYSEVGGGALPNSKLNSVVIALKCKSMSSEKLSKVLRAYKVPIITRIKNDSLLIDTRCLLDGDYKIIEDAFYEMFI